jgi:aerobic C4-dicarboxylate transport protein
MSLKRLMGNLYIQVLVAIVLGATVGYVHPQLGEQLKPLGDAFIKLIKMVIGPIVFTTVVVGIAHMGDMKKVGRVGIKSLIYFEVVTTLAMVIGMVVVKLYKPGAGINADPATLNTAGIDAYTSAAAKPHGTVDFLMDVIPNNIFDAFARGEILQIVFFSILFGLALAAFGERGKTLVNVIDEASHVLFGMINMLMKLAPIGAFGAMGFTIGKFGLGTLVSLGKLMAGVYTTSFLFVFVVLGLIAKVHGFSLIRFLGYIKEELFIVLGTSSSESVLPRMMRKLENLGCSKPVVGLVIPTGYSFNLDGTSIYLTMAALFVAQATNVDLTLQQEVTLLAILLITSKGAAAVTGGGFITLAATLSAVGTIPVAGMALLLGVDRFMSEARALTNLVGNGVATVVIAKWEGELDEERAREMLAGNPVPSLEPATKA